MWSARSPPARRRTASLTPRSGGGMKGLWESGIGQVLRGQSTVDELMRIVDVPQEEGGGTATESSAATAAPQPRASSAAGGARPPAPAASPPEGTTHFD